MGGSSRGARGLGDPTPLKPLGDADPTHACPASLWPSPEPPAKLPPPRPLPLGSHEVMAVPPAARFGVTYYTEKDNASGWVPLSYLTSRCGSVLTQHGFTLLHV